MKVIIAHEKHGVFAYATALGLLKQRIEDGYWYDGAALIAAQRAANGGETTAWVFLSARNDYEYEYVERQRVGP